MEIYYEQSLIRKDSVSANLLYALCWILIVILLLIAMFFGSAVLGNNPKILNLNWRNVIGMILCLLLDGILFVRKDHLRTEFDYILNGDDLEIHAVLNRKRRKLRAKLDIKRIRSAGMISAPACASLKKQHGTHVLDCRVEQAGYYLYYHDANARRMILLNLDDQMKALIQHRLAAGVWQNIEGK